MDPQINDDLHFTRVLYLLRRRWWVVVAMAVIGFAVAYAYSSLQPSLYRSVAQINIVTESEDIFSSSPVPNPQREVNTAIFITMSETVQDAALEELGDDADGVESIEASAAEETDIVEIAAVADSAELAQRAADAAGDSYIQVQQALDVQSRRIQANQLRGVARQLNDDIDVIDRSLFRGGPDVRLDALRVQRGRLVAQQADLRIRANELDIEADINAGSLQFVVPAELPESPFEPTPLQDASLAAGLGAFLGVTLVLAYDWVNNRVTTPDEVVGLTDGLPILASLPVHGDQRRRRRRLPAIEQQLVAVGSRADEAYRTLATSIRFSAVGRTTSTLAVTSAVPGEGKTTVVANLGRALAASGARVVIVSADLRRPRIGSVFDIDETTTGLTSVLLGEVTLAEALRPLDVGAGLRMALLPSGPLPGNAPAILGSEAFAKILTRIEEAAADVILVDTAPVLSVSDSLVVAQQVEGVVVTAVPDLTKKSNLVEAVRRLRAVEAEIVGVVMNGVTDKTGNYYGYGYSYGYRHDFGKSDELEALSVTTDEDDTSLDGATVFGR
ncbi:MAG TPA: polysaccharide biosynthesis tyrosine autokinase [Acidimicrobiales bacterium]